MKAAARLCTFLAFSIAFAVVGRSDDTVIPVLTLPSGRVLHQVRVMKDQPDSLILMAKPEGLVKVKKTDLPTELAAAYPVRLAPRPAPQLYMVPLDANALGSDTEQPALPTPKPNPAPKPKIAEPATIYRGCIIADIQLVQFQNIVGTAKVRIENDSDEAVTLQPSDLVCQTPDGTVYSGRFFITTPNEGGAYVAVKSESIAPHSSLTNVVTFSEAAATMTTIHWK